MDHKFITLEFHFLPGMIDGFMTELPSLLSETRKHEGFIEIAAHRHHDEPDKLILVERWSSVETYQRYLQHRIDSGMFDELGKILVSPPKLDRWEPAHITILGPHD